MSNFELIFFITLFFPNLQSFKGFQIKFLLNAFKETVKGPLKVLIFMTNKRSKVKIKKKKQLNKRLFGVFFFLLLCRESERELNFKEHQQKEVKEDK